MLWGVLISGREKVVSHAQGPDASRNEGQSMSEEENTTLQAVQEL